MASLTLPLTLPSNFRYVFIIFLFIVLNLVTLLISMCIWPLSLIPNNILHKFVKLIPFYLLNINSKIIDRLYFNINVLFVTDGDHDTYSDMRTNNKRYIFMGNHESFMDVLGSGHFGYRRFTIPVKRYLQYVPILGSLFSMMDFCFTDNGKSNNLVQIISTKLKNNDDISLCIFPEGSRFFDRKIDFDRIRTGGFVIAAETGIDIVPIYHTLMDAFTDTTMEHIFRFDNICLVGMPIKVAGKSIEELKKEYYETLLELRELHTGIMKKLNTNR